MTSDKQNHSFTHLFFSSPEPFHRYYVLARSPLTALASLQMRIGAAILVVALLYLCGWGCAKKKHIPPSSIAPLPSSAAALAPESGLASWYGHPYHGRRAANALPGLHQNLQRIPVTSSGNPASAQTVPIEIGDRELWLSISGVGYEDGIVYAFRDLTEERALEQIRQELVATVSHELRTPLAAIYGSAVTLRREDLALEPSLQNKLLEVIHEESSRLADIVNDLLLASQLDAGSLIVNIVHCDAVELARGVVDAARTHLPDGVMLELEEPKDQLPPVAADEGQLRQVLANLVDNAVKYSPGGGDVRITLEQVEGHLRFAVADRGLGIPASEQRRIFEKFYRVDPDMAGGIGGTGLGLYICRELVRRVDGRIWVEANDRRGSVFYVEIPFAREAAGVRPHEQAAARA